MHVVAMSFMPNASLAYLRIAPSVPSTAGDASETALSVRTHSVTATNDPIAACLLCRVLTPSYKSSDIILYKCPGCLFQIIYLISRDIDASVRKVLSV